MTTGLLQKQEAGALLLPRDLVRPGCADLGVVRLVGQDPGDLPRRDAACLRLPPQLGDRPALGDQDPLLLLQIRLLLVGEVDLGAGDALQPQHRPPDPRAAPLSAKQ